MAISNKVDREDSVENVPPPPVAASKGASHEDLKGGEGLQIRFRPNRYKVEDLGSLRWEITLTQKDGTSHSCEPLDVSASGVGISIPSDLVLRVNETLPKVAISYEGNLAYEGGASVITLREMDGVPFAGLHLLDGLLEVSQLLDIREIKNAQMSLRDELAAKRAAWNVEGYSHFKSLVADFRLFLEDTVSSLQEIEKKLPWHVVFGDTDSATRQGIRASFLDGPAATFCQYFTSIDSAVRAAGNVDEPLKHLARRHLQNYILQGPLFERSLAKPRGYAGDYVTMTYIYNRQFEGSSLFGQFIHQAGCQHDVCQAVRNRKDLLREIIKDIVTQPETEHQPRIASIGSGPAQEFYEVLQTMETDNAPFRVVLFDADDEALNYCFPRLTDMIRQRGLGEVADITMLFDSIAHLLFDDSVFRGTGPFDLLLCAGLFDYLESKKGQMLAAKLYSQLAPGGTLIIGNMTPINPSRWAMEHMAEWYLIYRNQDELMALLDKLPDDAEVDVLREPLGVNLFLKIRKAGNGHLDIG